MKRFHTNARTKSHVTYQHSRRDAGNIIKKIEVKNYKYRDTYGVLPYRKGTPRGTTCNTAGGDGEGEKAAYGEKHQRGSRIFELRL